MSKRELEFQKFQLKEAEMQFQFKEAEMEFQNEQMSLGFRYASVDRHLRYIFFFWELRQRVVDPVIICILGNKSDREKDREVSPEAANAYSDNIGADFFETSAFNGSGCRGLA